MDFLDQYKLINPILNEIREKDSRVESVSLSDRDQILEIEYYDNDYYGPAEELANLMKNEKMGSGQFSMNNQKIMLPLILNVTKDYNIKRVSIADGNQVLNVKFSPKTPPEEDKLNITFKAGIL